MDGYDLLATEMPPDPRRRWVFLDQAERDKAYDNNGAVANSAELVEARNRGSAAYRAAHAATLDIPYADGERTRFDLYPAADPQAPCLVFIHGGYWLRNSRELFATFAEGIAAHGWSVAMPGYTLAPEASVTQIAGEMHAAMDWLAREGPAHGIAGPVIVSGWSAGAHLATLVLGHPRVAAGLAISGVFELAPLRDTSMNQVLRLTAEEVQSLSPVRLPPTPKPLAITYGTAELPTLVWDSRRLHAMRAAAHMPGVLLPVAGADHFTILNELQRKDGTLVRLVISLLDGAAA